MIWYLFALLSVYDDIFTTSVDIYFSQAEVGSPQAHSNANNLSPTPLDGQLNSANILLSKTRYKRRHKSPPPSHINPSQGRLGQPPPVIAHRLLGSLAA
ncbi:hypothetical protein BJX64DRAFT_273282 [Aspergillus heterothallicus]